MRYGIDGYWTLTRKGIYGQVELHPADAIESWRP